MKNFYVKGALIQPSNACIYLMWKMHWNYIKNWDTCNTCSFYNGNICSVTISLICEWLGCLSICNLHKRLCLPRESISTPQGQVCWWPIMDPNCREQAIHNVGSASFRPKDEIGMSYRKSVAFSDETASRRAFSFLESA